MSSFPLNHKSSWFFKLTSFHCLCPTSSSAGLSNAEMCHAHSTLGLFYHPRLAFIFHSGYRLTWNVTSSEHFSEQFKVSTHLPSPIILSFVLFLHYNSKTKSNLLTYFCQKVSFVYLKSLTCTLWHKVTSWIHVRKRALDLAADKPKSQLDSNSVAEEILLSERAT